MSNCLIFWISKYLNLCLSFVEQPSKDSMKTYMEDKDLVNNHKSKLDYRDSDIKSKNQNEKM